MATQKRTHSPYYYGTQEDLTKKINTGFKLIKGCPWVNKDTTKDAWLLHPDTCTILHVKGIKGYGAHKGEFYWTEHTYDGYENKWFNNCGYLMCNVGGKTVLLHRIMAETFVPNDDPENKTYVQHIVATGHKKRMNMASNLRWVTKEEKNARISKAKKRNFGRYYHTTSTFNTADGRKIKMSWEDYLAYVEETRGKTAANILRTKHEKKLPQTRYGNLDRTEK